MAAAAAAWAAWTTEFILRGTNDRGRLTPASAFFYHRSPLDLAAEMEDGSGVDGGVLVSTWEKDQRRHAEDGSLASLIIEPKINANEELALAA